MSLDMERLARGRALVGKHVQVQWGVGMSYVGQVVEFNEDDGKHKVEYTDGDVKWHDLNKMRWSEVSEAELKPRQVQRGELSSVLPPPPRDGDMYGVEWMNRCSLNDVNRKRCPTDRQSQNPTDKNVHYAEY